MEMPPEAERRRSNALAPSFLPPSSFLSVTLSGSELAKSLGNTTGRERIPETAQQVKDEKHRS